MCNYYHLKLSLLPFPRTAFRKLSERNFFRQEVTYTVFGDALIGQACRTFYHVVTFDFVQHLTLTVKVTPRHKHDKLVAVTEHLFRFADGNLRCGRTVCVYARLRVAVIGFGREEAAHTYKYEKQRYKQVPHFYVETSDKGNFRYKTFVRGFVDKS